VTHRRLAALAAVLLLAVAGCARSADDPAPATSATPTVPTGTSYALPAKLCDKVDSTALQDLYPTPDEPLLDTSISCDTALIAASDRVLGLFVDAHFADPALLAVSPQLTQETYELQRRLARSTPTDIDGAGSAAFWYAIEDQLWLVSYDGNLLLTVSVAAVNATHRLAPDMPTRLTQVAAATMAALAS
jgi:hypothetical protein